MNERVPTNDRWLQAEEALRESRALALAGQYAEVTMHEINRPLAAIAKLNYLIQINSRDATRVSGYSRLMEEQLQILTEISRQTLSFYYTKESVEKVQIAPLAEAALHIHGQKLTAKEIRLVKELADDVMIAIQPRALLQLFSNLIANAVEALPTRGTLLLRLRAVDGEVHMLIADNGPGIPPEILPNIFEPFVSTKKEPGAGLGLAIARSIIERHHGTIRSRTSTRDGLSGTAFRICLPLRRPSSAHELTSAADE
ncbi:MAG: sensor histidine kinase [Terracidiphilus sp.]